ncbi:uncharacterized protein LOC134203228 [Armigeres subalbatus]|uniref:uncharacterized protein LOC134203228 n=1 Tax=Armigeres subalbatus TaxID=124917 RepID=UPI002ED09C30
MDQISLTDLRRQFFGPTLDESLLYGVECLRDFFSWRQHFDTDPTYSQTSRERSDSVVSDFNLYQSCRDLNELAHSPTESAISKKQNRYRRKLSNEQKGKPSILNIKSERKSSLSSDQVRPKRKVSTSECHCWADENAIAKTSPSSKQLQDYQVLSSEEMKEQKRSSLSSNTEEFESTLSAKSKSCAESSKEENVSKIKNAINSSPSLKEPSKLSRTDKLFSSSEQSSKTKPSSNGSSKILEKLKKELANSFIYETKTSPSTPPTRGRHTPRLSRHSRQRSLSSPPAKNSSSARRPKQIRSRWAFVKVNEFDDGAKTYDVLQTDLRVVDVQRLKGSSVDGTITAADLPPDMATEVVFVTLPDGSTLCYLGDDVKR